MKKALMFLAATFCLVFAAQSYSRKNNFFSEEGTVCSFGNMPFNFPGFVTEDGRQYFIEADDSMKSELLGTQGKKILLTGTIIENEKKGFVTNRLKDGSVKAVSFEIIEE